MDVVQVLVSLHRIESMEHEAVFLHKMLLLHYRDVPFVMHHVWTQLGVHPEMLIELLDLHRVSEYDASLVFFSRGFPTFGYLDPSTCVHSAMKTQ